MVLRQTREINLEWIKDLYVLKHSKHSKQSPDEAVLQEH